MPRALMTASYHCSSGLRWARRRGSRMFSLALRVGRRLKAWNTKPSLSRRTAVNCLSPMPARSCPAMSTDPEVGESNPARQCSRVDLPDPDGPIMATNWPRPTLRLTPPRATTRASPDPYTRTTSRASTTTSAPRVVWNHSAAVSGTPLMRSSFFHIRSTYQLDGTDSKSDPEVAEYDQRPHFDPRLRPKASPARPCSWLAREVTLDPIKCKNRAGR